MLPSTGYFKTINCPFYDNGSCERPYCHFKHPRREDTGNAATVEMVEAQTASQVQEDKSSTIMTPNSNMLEDLVKEAVKKALADQEITGTENFSKNIISQVVEELKPTLASNSTASIHSAIPNIVGKHIAIPTTITKPTTCIYNPTPIAELKKRHIPVVSYMPTRENRVAVKRKSSPERIKPWLNIVQESINTKEPKVTYKPTTIISIAEDAVQSYIPTVKSDSYDEFSLNSYDDSNSSDYQSKFKEAYYPKSKKKREEYVPKKVKAPLKTVQQLDDTIADRFESDYNIIDKIFTASHSASDTLGQAKILNENSQDYFLDIEPKFSDDEAIEDIFKDGDGVNIKKIEQINDVDEKKKESLQFINTVNTKTSNNDSKIDNNYYDVKIGDINNDDKSKEESEENKSLEKKENSRSAEEIEIHKSNKSNEKDRKISHRSPEKKNKEKSKYKSDSKDRHHSSSSRHKDRRKSSHNSKDSSRKDKEHSQKKRHISPKRNQRDHQKSSHHDKHRSKTSSSSSKSDRHTSSKSDKKHHSSSSKKSSSSSKKSSKHKENNNKKNSSDSSDNLADIYPFTDDEDLKLSDSDHDIQEECLKIFQEYQVSDHPNVVSEKEPLKRESEEVGEIGRKRIAHPSATCISRQGSSHTPKKFISPHQKMYERWQVMAQLMNETNVNNKKAEGQSNPSALELGLTGLTSPTIGLTGGANSQSSANCQSTANIHSEHSALEGSTLSTVSSHQRLNGNSRIRIAHVPYAKLLTLEKKKVQVITNKNEKTKATDIRTTAQTTKGVRVAHIPQMMPQAELLKPIQVSAHKFPPNVRECFIKHMYDISIHIYGNVEEAAERARTEEFKCHEKCKVLTVYKNSCKSAVYRLKKEYDDKSKIVSPVTGTVRHEDILAGKAKGSWSVLTIPKNDTNVRGPALYNKLKKWILTEQQLKDNGFPRVHPDGPKGRAKIYAVHPRNKNIPSPALGSKICCRCAKEYKVDRFGAAVEQQNCIYHWGRKFSYRSESLYNCCHQDATAAGCSAAEAHVSDYTDYENLNSFVATFSKDIPEERQGVYALDCEMGYTTQGLELIRVTVIDENCEVVYEKLVKPFNPIVDYSTRFSGITENDMKNVTTTILDVQASLLSMFSNKTILVGHSLESDFKALKLIHDTVVDTSVMYPHKNGYPYKRALKNICAERIDKIIQNDTKGHDSKEDAVACMELVYCKVKSE